MENRQGEGKNSVGNVEAKELISMTHGHEPTWEFPLLQIENGNNCTWTTIEKIELDCTYK